MKLRYKYRLYPNKNQETKLRQFSGSTRYLWNQFLTRQKQEYNENKKFIFFTSMCAELIQLKKETFWLRDVHAQVLQQKLKQGLGYRVEELLQTQTRVSEV